MSHVLHFETPKPEIDNLTDCVQVFVPNDEDITDGPSYNSYPLVQLPRRNERLSFSFSEEWDRFRLPVTGGNFSVVVGGFQTNYSFSRFLTLSALIQMDTANTQACECQYSPALELSAGQ